jgi:hypothetical protein
VVDGPNRSLLARLSACKSNRTYVALAADHLVAVVLGSEGLKGGLNEAATETEDEMQGGFFLDVIVA